MTTTDEVYALAQRYLSKVRRSGPSDIMALCPFHRKMDGTEERRPSFAMSLTKGLYLCHSCHAKGNLYTFLRDIGVERPTIQLQYRHLIDEVSKNIPLAPDPLRPGVFNIPEIAEDLLGLFDYCPTELLDDGFRQPTLYHFEVGYDGWHDRITYPLRDLKGKLVGISGGNKRFLPKYKVYSTEYRRWDLPEVHETEKRVILWNAHNVYPDVFYKLPGESSVVVVEGFKACMWVHQAGIRNVVALLGTYLSWEHKWMLERLGAPVYLFLDNDTAGRKGTIQAAEALSRSLTVHVVPYPDRLLEDDAQPDDCTAEEVLDSINKAPPYLNWLLDHIS